MTLMSLKYYLTFKWNTEEAIGVLKRRASERILVKTEWRDIGLYPTLKVIRLVIGQGEKEGEQTEKTKLRVWPVWGNGDRGDKEEGGIK